MSFSIMLKILRENSKDKIVLINAGAFYIAVEEDEYLNAIEKFYRNIRNEGK